MFLIPDPSYEIPTSQSPNSGANTLDYVLYRTVPYRTVPTYAPKTCTRGRGTMAFEYF